MANLQHIFPGGFTAAITSTELVDPIPAFQAHCKAAGLVVEAIVDDGEIHRVPTLSSKRGALDGWYILHTSGKFPVGVCGDWRTDVQHKWAAQTGRQLTFQERADHAKWIEEVKAKQAAARAAAQADAAERADAEVGGYADASAEHPYLQRKQVQPHGIKIDRAGKLVVPIYNADGEIISHQTIDADGNKRFLKGGRVEGGFFEIRGTRGVVFIGEGFATCASVHEATGATVLVAFDAGNLPRVAKVAKALYVGSKLVMAADNDQFTDNNPGMRAANTAAHAVHGLVVHPEFSEAEVLAGKPTDFNDLHVLRGLDAVRDRIEMVTAPVREGLAFEFSRVDSLELSEIKWVVDDYIEADSLAQVFGDPGGGKSFVAIDIACCIATGTPWHGHEVQRGAVFYVAGEGHNGLTRRFKAWELGNGISLEGASLYKSHRAAQLSDTGDASLVAASIKSLVEESGCQPAMIVIDTLARNFGGDENSTQDMGLFIQNLDTYLRQSYRCCVMVVHHSGAMDKERSRGSTALRGALDAEYKVQLDPGSKTIMFEPKKMKDAELPPSMSFGITQVDLPINDKHGEPVKGAYLTAVDISGFVKSIQKDRRLGKNQRICLESITALQQSLRDQGDKSAVSPDEWRDSVKTHGVDRRRWFDAKKWLIDNGMVFENKDGFYVEAAASETSETSETDATGQGGQA
jgi:phage/plasmid primase-like uncharacterized protein